MIFTIPVPDIMYTSACNFNCKYCFEHDKIGDSISDDLLNKILETRSSFSFFPFGGEPLLVLDKIVDTLKYVESLNMFEEHKKKLIGSIKNIITNGSLIKKHAETLKRYGFSVQISVDGPPHVNDINRVDHNGKGTFELVLEAIQICKDNGIKWSLHGVVNKETLRYLFQISSFFYENYMENLKFDEFVKAIGRNPFQIIFESDYSESDIDLINEQIDLFCDYVKKDDRLTEEQRKEVIKSYLMRKGAACAAGTTLFAVSPKGVVYPCHRNVLNPDHELGYIFKPHEFKNYKLFNSYFRLRYLNSKVYSVNGAIDSNNIPNWINWCPTTNLETTGSVYYQAPKYNYVFNKVGEHIKTILDELNND